MKRLDLHRAFDKLRTMKENKHSCYDLPCRSGCATVTAATMRCSLGVPHLPATWDHRGCTSGSPSRSGRKRSRGVASWRCRSKAIVPFWTPCSSSQSFLPTHPRGPGGIECTPRPFSAFLPWRASWRRLFRSWGWSHRAQPPPTAGCGF